MPASIRPEEAMRRAIRLSRRGFPAPNPHVGCVLVRGGAIVGEGWHDYAGGHHAEVVALQQAGERAIGATAYVTLEPCHHTGRTGPCTEALREAGVVAVRFACPDPNPRAAGGSSWLRSQGIEVEGGICEQEAARENTGWLRAMRLGRPFVTLKAACSLDGRIATASGESQWITGPAARRMGHRLRAEMGAVLVGRRTAELDQPRLTARIKGVHNQPLRVLLDPKGKVPEDAPLFREPGEAIRFVATGSARTPFDVEAPLLDGSLDLQALLAHLWNRGITGLLVEGGAVTAGSFLKAGLADRIDLFVAPIVLGDGPSWVEGPSVDRLSEAPRFDRTFARDVGGDLWVRYERDG
ncbi:MAG: bifunctional diaminohydroxyphosphoribosylaminopyrimidine deaminase/5-amino-6-(5-phosphoribosylamino)uracil reductase RibD [Armatimonadetes bacterium]|nr:bifunctional diaminohydroxyphosphoribosylaminopyrimidine deaminase/5-amino-6-(5-phosphoribosylamino)uracil reductase RibD [Armatimonadota bacterium]